MEQVVNHLNHQHKVYTLGYHSLSGPEELRDLADQLGAVVADVRLYASSKNPLWKDSQMREVLGKRYKHLPTLGNINHRAGAGAGAGAGEGRTDRGIKLSNPAHGLPLLAAKLKEESIIVLCACFDYHHCHRLAVVEQLQALIGPQPCEVEHLYGSRQSDQAANVAVKLAQSTLPFIPALTIRQPWLTFILHAGKRIENRSWATPYRGPVFLHAGRQLDRDCFGKSLLGQALTSDLLEALAAKGIDVDARLMPRYASQYPTGQVLAVADLVDCVTNDASPWFIPGQYGFVLDNVRPIEPGVECLGQQKLFRLPQEVVAKLDVPNLLSHPATKLKC